MNRAILCSSVVRKIVSLVEESTGSPLSNEVKEAMTYAISSLAHSHLVFGVGPDTLLPEHRAKERETHVYSRVLFEDMCKLGGSPVLIEEFPEPMFFDHSSKAVIFAFDLKKVFPQYVRP